MSSRRFALPLAFTLACGAAGTACTDDKPASTVDMAPAVVTAVSSVALTDSVDAPGLGGPVDLVRDEWGVPHIYGRTLADVSWVQGYVMAEDRLVQMDLARHKADGTLSLLVGALSDSVIDGDIQMRAHHLRKNAETTVAALRASTDPVDVKNLAALTSFAAGVNAYLADLRSGRYSQPPQLAFIYDPKTTLPWTVEDEVVLAELQTFLLSFDADSEINFTRIQEAARLTFDQATDPLLSSRKGIGDDLEIFTALDPTHTIDGWTGMNGDTSHASLVRPRRPDGNFLALLEADSRAVRDLGDDHSLHPSRGSNNWVVGPSLSATGHAMVANDTHLALNNPATFYLLHLVARGGEDPVEVMGVEFPGAPAVVLGMNRHIAWGSTVSYLDVTDVYAESVVACDGSSDPCVQFNGKKVALVPRKETFQVGRFGKVLKTVEVTLWDVPHHGPIIPRSRRGVVEPLGQSELSIRYVGHTPANVLRAVAGIDRAASRDEALAALDRDFKYGRQNWVFADDQGHIGWTQIHRMPRRAAGHAPWKVLPGDGSAEWGADLDPKYIPHAYDPPKGFLATANADPIGTTDDGEPFADEPLVDGVPLYLGADYDSGTRVGRITKRILAMSDGGKKLSLDDMQAIQSDTVSEWAQALAPTAVDAARALVEELATPGTHAELKALAATLSSDDKALVTFASNHLAGWTSFETPAGTDEDSPSPQMVADSQSAFVFAAWWKRFTHVALDDELARLGVGVSDDYLYRLLVRMCNAPEKLKSGIAPETGDARLFDDLTTSPVEGKRVIAARALVLALHDLVAAVGKDPAAWRWGQLHTLTLDFLAPVAALQVPLSTDAKYPHGFPRHGAIGTVDVGHYSPSDFTDYSYSEGPAIRFACELTPTGPKARNVLPGGEIFDPASPHYRDQLELWRKNASFDLAFEDADVVASAGKELAKNKLGRVRFTPVAATR